MEHNSSPAPSVVVGLDVHKDTITVAVAHCEGELPSVSVVDRGEIHNAPNPIGNKVRSLRKEFGDHLHFVYEAGPCGFALLRRLQQLGYPCEVVAPSRMPKRSADRVKTDRRDARELARYRAYGDLTPIWVPDPQHEAIRELVRLRAKCKQSKREMRQSIGSFLLRRERHWSRKTTWNHAHEAWIRDQKFEQSADQSTLHTMMEALVFCERQLNEIELALHRELNDWQLTPLVNSLRALRGVDRVTAVSLLAELGDLRRFPNAGSFMSYLGLTPSEHSSGGRRKTGAITKTGNGAVRRLLTESAWTYRFPARETHHMQRKAENASDYAKERAWAAQERLCRRYLSMVREGKSNKTAVTAIARELAGFIWDIVCHEMPAVTEVA